jgi:hypothetical protein
MTQSQFERQRTRRSALRLIALGVILLVLLIGSAWAAWGSDWSLAADFGAFLGDLQATATPTRTPRPVTATATTIPVELAIILPTATPPPTAAPASQPPPEITPEPLPARLAEVAARYGIDPARRFIVVDLDAQQMTIWDPADGPLMGGRMLREMPVSTGDESKGYRTLAWYGLVGDYWGTFNAFGVFADEGWYLFEDAGSILIHSAPYRLVDGRKVYEEMDALGAYPASKGCIRLAPEDASWFTRWGPQGVPIVILPRGGSQ